MIGNELKFCSLKELSNRGYSGGFEKIMSRETWYVLFKSLRGSFLFDLLELFAYTLSTGLFLDNWIK